MNNETIFSVIALVIAIITWWFSRERIEKWWAEHHFNCIAKQTCYEKQFEGYIPNKREAAQIAEFLGKRYNERPFSFSGGSFPIANLWHTTDFFEPDKMLAEAENNDPYSMPPYLKLIPQEHLDFMRAKDVENNKAQARNDREYRMITYREENQNPRIRGGIGLWDEHLLSQRSLKFELAKCCLERKEFSINQLPRRKCFEEEQPESSMRNAQRRCAAIAITTLVAIRERQVNGTGYQFKYISAKRSSMVAHSPNWMSIAPGGMFTCCGADIRDAWSIKKSVLREFAEEILGAEEMNDPVKANYDQEPEYQALQKLLERKESPAILSATAFSIDLASLAPEISTIFVIDREDFLKLPVKQGHWEFFNKQFDQITLNRVEVEKCFRVDWNKYVPTCAVTISRGLDWLEARGWLTPAKKPS